MRHRLLSRFRAVGLTSPSAPAELTVGTGKANERQRRTAELVDAGSLVMVEVEGLKGMRYAIAGDRSRLDETAGGGRVHHSGVAFIAPLDPLLWDRRLLRELWDFDYLWEVYVPEHKRRYGYYVLPILFGDRFVGRIEPRLERASRTLRVLGISWEAWFSPRQEAGFIPAMRDALRAYMTFVGADRIEWMPKSAVAGRLFGTLNRKSRSS